MELRVAEIMTLHNRVSTKQCNSVIAGEWGETHLQAYAFDHHQDSSFINHQAAGKLNFCVCCMRWHLTHWYHIERLTYAEIEKGRERELRQKESEVAVSSNNSRSIRK